MEKINIVLLGHLDHGKSTLIGRMLYETKSILPDKIIEIEQMCKNLGKDMEYAFFLDAFQDEVEGGMTIDTIMAILKGKKHEYNVIDCPGHKEFIKNMLSGASNASAAILVISAKKDEGVQEQTKRHVFLAKMLGIKQLFVAVNKMDMRNYDQKIFNQIKQDAEIFLKKIGYNNIFFVPISSKNGDNVIEKSKKMEWYLGKSLFEIVEENIIKMKSKSELPLRMSIQDKYGDILVGRVETGKIKVGQEVIFIPSGGKTKISSIEKFNETKKEAEAGESIGIKLDSNLEINRGELCSEIKNIPKITNEIHAEIFVLGDKPLKENEPLSIRILTREKKCKISEIYEKINSSSGESIKSEKEIGHLDAAKVKIICEDKMIAENFSKMQELGRLVLTNDKEISAVGIII